MGLTKLQFVPGITKIETDYASEGRFIDGDKVRFVAGRPQKIGGWAKTLETAVSGLCRGGHAWIDNTGRRNAAWGTHRKLYSLLGGSLTDITPLRGFNTGTLANPISTTNGSATVNVAHTAHGLSTGDYAKLTAASAVGGVTIAGWYAITVVDANNYSVTASSAATATAGPAGGTTAYAYQRKTLTNPFDTTNGSTTVVVNHTAHGCANGDTVIIAGASAVGGITPSGAYVMFNVTSNAYSITHSAAATSTVTGGGGSPTVQYELTVGQADNIPAYGWGVGTWGSGTWGTPRTSSVIINCRTWALANYGQKLVANPAGGGIYEWDPDTGGRALPIYNAPDEAKSMLVTEERIIVALSADGDEFVVKWNDQDDRTIWTAAATNTANSRRLQAQSGVVAGLLLGAQVFLVWSAADTFVFQWSGDDYIYASRRASGSAGLIGPHAAAELNGIAYWMSDGDFHVYDGAARRLPSDDIRDYVFGRLNRNQARKCVAAANKKFNEIWFFYPSTTDEIDSYAAYHIDSGVWATGAMVRTAWVDSGVFDYPLATDGSGYIYDHESGVDSDGAALDSWITAAPQDIGDGDATMDVLGLIPDFENLSGALTLTLLTRVDPDDSDTEEATGSYSSGDGRLDDFRGHGSMAGLKIRSNVVGGNWRLGAIRVDLQASGYRR